MLGNVGVDDDDDNGLAQDDDKLSRHATIQKSATLSSSTR